MPIDILNIKPSTISRDLRGKYILLYGKAKVGKTSFAVQAPRALVCAFELGGNALDNAYFQPIDKWHVFKQVVAQLRKPEAKDMYDTIVIDTVSIAYDLCEAYICSREQVDSIRDVPWGQGWGMVKKEFQETLREITMLGYGLILIAHDKQVNTNERDAEGNPIVMTEPDIPSKAYDVCNAICDIIGYINVEGFEKMPDGTYQGKRYLYTRQTPTIFAGSRYQYLSGRIEFGYKQLVDAIGDALDMAAQKNGAVIVDHAEFVGATARPFSEAQEEAKQLWTGYLAKATSDEDAEYRRNILVSAVTQAFGKPTKLSSVLPNQIEQLEVAITLMKELPQ